ncbi:phospholipase A(2), partial [Trichonephila clavata]
MIKRLWRVKDIHPLKLGIFCCLLCLSSGLILTPLRNKTIIARNDAASDIRRDTTMATKDREADFHAKAQAKKFRFRRNVMQMARMLKCMSGCNPLSYRGYGCYCGYMGSGQPVDDID